jgi:Plasmid encoded RepA protein
LAGVEEGPRAPGEGLQASLDRIEQRLQDRPALPSAEPNPEPSAPVEQETAPLAVEDQAGDDTGELAYTPSVFAQLSLPYRNPGDVARWVRTNGLMTLTVRPGEWFDPKTGEDKTGYPYGVIPRLIVLWMATEAKRTQERELVLGPSLTAFTGKLIIGRNPGRRSWPGGGPTGSLTRLGDQLRRMLTATVTIRDRRDLGSISEHRSAVFSFASESRLWWSHDVGAADRPLWDSTVTLSEPFYEAIASGALPLPTEALIDLRSRTSSPMALDTYVWLAHRLHRVKGSTPPIGWSDLAVQFGADYAHVRQFKAQFLKELAHVLAVYPAARVDPGPKGLVLRHSPSPVPPKSRFSRQRPVKGGSTT